jgi:O-antigen ligase
MFFQYSNDTSAGCHNEWLDYKNFPKIAGGLGVYLFSFGILFKTSISQIGLLLMILPLCFDLKLFQKSFLSNRLFILSIFFAVFVFLRSAFTMMDYRDHYWPILNRTLLLTSTVFFIVPLVAFWMNRFRFHWGGFVVAFTAGYFANIFRNIDWAQLSQTIPLLWSGAQRAYFGFPTNRFGFWSATILLFWTLLSRRFIGNFKLTPIFCIKVFLWSAIYITALLGVVFSQSRAAWLCSLLIIPTAMLFIFFDSTHYKIFGLILSIATLATILYIASTSSIFKNRISGIDDYIEEISINNQQIGDNFSSIQERLLLYELFWKKWKEGYFVGFGPGSSTILIKTSDTGQAKLERYKDFHNSIVEILLQLGIIGFLFYSLSLYLILKASLNGRKMGLIDKDFFILGISGFTMFLLFSMSCHIISNWKGVFFMGFLGGLCYAISFVRSTDTETFVHAH